MMRRLAGLSTAAVAALVLVGCLPPPPPGWVAPVVTASVSPDPVAAGQPFTVEVTAIDPVSVTAIEIQIRPPKRISGSDPAYPNQTCVAGDFVPAPTVIDATVLGWRFTDCLIPTGSSPFTYGAGFDVEDALGYTGRMSILVQAVIG